MSWTTRPDENDPASLRAELEFLRKEFAHYVPLSVGLRAELGQAQARAEKAELAQAAAEGELSEAREWTRHHRARAELAEKALVAAQATIRALVREEK